MAALTGRVAVVTGGASGIGEAVVRLFVAEGAQVLIADIQDRKGAVLAAELGGQAHYHHTDVSVEDDVRAMIDAAHGIAGRLDCLFNNAGIAGPGGPIESTAATDFDLAIAVHLRGVFLGIKHAAPVMKRQGFGSLINTGSVAGLRTGYANHVYSAAKAAIIHLTRSVATELAEHNVRVNCVCPGVIATPIFGKAFGLADELADATIGVAEQALASFGQPLRRAGLPEDIARAVLWLASDASSFVTGHALVVDGGLIAGRGWSEAQQTWRQLARALRSAP